MKVVHLLRHAKSDWDDVSLTDHERPLSKRGIAAAKAMGRHLGTEAFQVDAIYCSTACRARETLKHLGRAVHNVPVVLTDALYMVTPEDVFILIKRAPETAQSLLVIGHNPTTQDAALSLIGRAAPGQREALNELRAKYPTGALASIRCNLPRWRNLVPGVGTLLRFLTPRDLARMPPRKHKIAKRSPRR